VLVLRGYLQACAEAGTNSCRCFRIHCNVDANDVDRHAVDDQSFPLEVRSLPRLAPVAQFGPKHIYSVENITALVAYAKSRGIRVMLEVDTPGHCQVLELAYPELGLIAECPGTTCWPPLDVSKNRCAACIGCLPGLAFDLFRQSVDLGRFRQKSLLCNATNLI